jgi:cytochrome c biogenesis protein CcdA
VTIEIGLAGAFFGGLLALISPCSALLLPSFFAYAFGTWQTLVARTAAFTLGLAAVLVPLGAGVGAVGSLLTRYRYAVTMTGGAVMIALGVAIALGFGFALPGTASRIGRLKVGSAVSAVLLGALYGLAGFCAGPLLGGVLTLAATGGTPWYGGLLMAAYAVGMALPLFLLALLWDRLRLGTRSWLRGRELRIGPVRSHSTALISGLLFVGIGVLFLLTDGTASVGSVVGVEAEFAAQLWARRVAGAIGDVWMWFGLTLIVLAAMVLRVVRRSRRSASADREGAR